MSDRLKRRARTIKRKRERSDDHSMFATVTSGASPDDPWAKIPESQRKKTVTTMPNGIVVTNYTDTLEDLARPAKKATKAAAAPQPPREPLAPPPIADMAERRPDEWSALDEADRREEGESQ